MPNEDKLTSSLPVEPFDSTVDDFEEWVEEFEAALTVATGVTDQNRLAMCVLWLKVKLDKEGKNALRGGKR